MTREQGGADEVGVEDAGERHPPGSELFDDAGIGTDVEAEPAVLGRDRHAEQAHRLHTLDEIVGVGVGVLEVGRDREPVPLHKAANRRDQLVGECHIGGHERMLTSPSRAQIWPIRVMDPRTSRVHHE